MPGPSTEPPAAAPRCLLLVADDLITPSRVREGVRPLGFAVRVTATDAAVREMAGALPAPAAILVNLTARRYDPVAVIAALKANAATATIPILAFAGHVEKEKHEAARAAGADLVAANSSVALHLPALLARLLAGSSSLESSDVVEIEAAGAQ
jgi:CheY-like chemotaxis protein